MFLKFERGTTQPPPLWAVAVVVVWLGSVLVFTGLNYAMESDTNICVLKTTTGVPCPTCGSTRLSLNMFRGHVVSAFLQNPLMWCALLGAVVWLFVTFVLQIRVSLALSPRGRRIFWAVLAALFLLNWAYVIAIDGPWDNAVKRWAHTTMGIEES